MKQQALVGLILVVAHVADSQPSKIDSLIALYHNHSGSEAKIELSQKISFAYLDQNLDSTRWWAEQSLALAEESKNAKGKILALLAYGNSQWRMGDFVRGLEVLTEALLLSRKNSLEEEEALSLMNIGILYNYLGKYTQSLFYYRNSQRILKTKQETDLYVKLLSNMAGVYSNLGDYDKGLEYWSEALEISYRLKATNVSYLLNNIGRSYTDKGDYNTGLRFLQKAMNRTPKPGDCSYLYPLENMAYTYYKLNNFDSANVLLQKGIKQLNVCDDVVLKIDLYTTQGQVLTKSGHLPTAIYYLKEAYETGSKFGVVREASRAAKALSLAYEQAGDYRKSIQVYKSFQTLSDSIFNLKEMSNFGKQEASFEYELLLKNQEMTQTIKDLEAKKKLEQQAMVRNTLIIAVVGSFIAAYVFYGSFKKKKLLSLKLESLNREINEQKEELLIINNTISQLNNELEEKIQKRTHELLLANETLVAKNKKMEEYAFFNSHKLRAPVASILGLASLFKNTNLETNDYLEIIERIQVATQELDTVVREMQTIVYADDLPNNS